MARRFTWCDALPGPEFGVDRKWLAERQTDAIDRAPRGRELQ